MNRSPLLLLLIIANLAGAFYGFFIYYPSQFVNTPLALWIFVPDCPLYVFVFAVALLLSWKGVENDAFSFIVSIGLMKYGLWTMFALAYYGWFFFSAPYAIVSAVIFALHFGMAAEGLVPRVRRCGIGVLAIGFAWFLLNDLMDYVVGTAPYLPRGADVGAAAIFAVASTLILVPLLWLTKRKGWLIPLGLYATRRR